MGQFVVAMLIGGFFSTLVLCLQHLFIVAEENNKPKIEIEAPYHYEVYLPYCASLFRDPKNHPWLFTDKIMQGIINYFRSELTYYKDDFNVDESIELSYILYEKTSAIERFIRQTKRGKFDEKTYNEILDVKFKDSHEEKLFLLTSVIKEAHNSLIDDLFAGKLKCLN